jgi:hypothetical protein
MARALRFQRPQSLLQVDRLHGPTLGFQHADQRCPFIEAKLAACDCLEDRPDRAGQVLDPIDAGRVEGNGPRLPLGDDAFEAEAQCRRVALERELDRLSGQRLGLALQQAFRRERRAVAAARRPAGEVARLPLLKGGPPARRRCLYRESTAILVSPYL